jgi:outer membrane murein-binding lipoprotein Lpp
MNTHKTLRFVALGALLLCGCTSQSLGGTASSGGRSSGTLVAGRVDTATILQSDPEYATLSKDYFTEQLTMKQDFVKAARAAGKNGNEQAKLREQFMTRQKALDQKWVGKTKDFLETRHTRLDDAVAAICKDKGIDLVVIDSKLYPSVEYGATDITQDVVTRIYGDKAVTPTASPTAGAKS